MKKIFLFTCLEVLSTAAKKLCHVAVISIQITFFFWKVVQTSGCTVYYKWALSGLQKAVGNVLKITLVWKMTSAHVFKPLNNCEYVKGSFYMFYQISSPLNAAQTSTIDVKLFEPPTLYIKDSNLFSTDYYWLLIIIIIARAQWASNKAAKLCITVLTCVTAPLFAR